MKPLIVKNVKVSAYSPKAMSMLLPYIGDIKGSIFDPRAFKHELYFMINKYNLDPVKDSFTINISAGNKLYTFQYKD